MNKKQYIQIAKKFGTPLYVYDADKIIKNYHQFVSPFTVKRLKVHYACKALSNINILRIFKSLGAGLDCVSEEEVLLGLKAGFQPENIIYTPNGVSIEEYDRVSKLNTKLTVDNLHILEHFGINHPERPIFIRINPHLMAGGNNNISVGHIDSKFGISIHQMPHVVRVVNSLKMNIEGIHVHTGSDIIDFDIFLRVSDLIFSLADNFPSIDSVDFGSGFKVKYKDGDMYTDIEEFGKVFSKKFNEYCTNSGKNLILRFEPGKVLVSDAGTFLTQVNLVKQTTSCTFVAINSGFNHFIRPMFYDAYHEVINLSNPNGPKKLYTLVGHICETDTFATNRLLNEVSTDDILAFKNAGAYCFEMSSSYNSRLKPAEILIYKNKPYIIRKKETLEDLLKNQEIIDRDF